MTYKFRPPERAVIASRSVALSNEVVRVGRPEAEVGEVAVGHGQQTVEVIRLDDRVQAIDVICACGERTRIRCVYEDQPKKPRSRSTRVS